MGGRDKTRKVGAARTEGGTGEGGRQERMKEPDKKTNEKKLEILERERQELRRCAELRDRERQGKTSTVGGV